MAILNNAVSQNVFTAWSFANRNVCVSSFFADECDPPLEGNCDWLHSLHPVFDLASLTKPLLTNLFLRVTESDLMGTLNTPLCELLTSPRNGAGEVLKKALQNSALTLNDILCHRSGVPPWMWFGKGAWHFTHTHSEAKALADTINASKFRERFEETITHFATEKLSSHPVTEAYSDIGYFLASRILENISSQHHQSWKERIEFINTSTGSQFSHASLTPHIAERAIPSYPYTALQNHIVPSGAFQKREFGNAHDTNANTLAAHGIVSGHAGLFGNILDVVWAVQALSKSQYALQRVQKNTPQARFVFGLDTPSGAESAAGPQTWPLPAGEKIFGHLGYTGTMFWLLQNRESALTNFSVLLTNRTAHRTVIGGETVPRVVVVTTLPEHLSTQGYLETDQNQTHYFLQQAPSANLKPVSRNEAEETVVAHARSTTRIWNDSCLRAVPNIQAIRNSVSKSLW
jgi:CubicO group peptidase (beta-lactamase class C family)